jgi:hypothetical protein
MAAGVGFSLAHPIDWQVTEQRSQHPGIVLTMEPDDRYTLFAVEAVDVDEPLEPDDADVLHQEVLDAIDGLPGAELIESKPLNAGLLRGADVRYDVDVDGLRLRRWVRILAERNRQLTVTAQGSSPDRFDHWEPQFFTTMASVRIHQGAERPTNEQLQS